MSGIEGIGEAVTGSMIARTVEPAAGEATATDDAVEPVDSRSCLNCGAELVGPYCHACGQNGHVHRTVGAWWHDFLHSVLHLDGKMWRTLPLLAWRPGELTRRYIAGERARFISPTALFLFSVFLMFAVFGMVGQDIGSSGENVRTGLGEGLRQTQLSISRIERERADAARAHRPTAEIDARLRSAREEARLLRTMNDRGLLAGTTTRLSDDVPAWLRHGMEKAARNPDLLLYKLRSNAYKFSWSLIPISVPFLWLLMLHRRRYREGFTAYDHLVFITYSISFMSLVLVVAVVVNAIGIRFGPLDLAFMLIPPVHIYRQLRGAYGLGRLSSAWRTAALVLFASVALLVFLILLLGIGFMG